MQRLTRPYKQKQRTPLTIDKQSGTQQRLDNRTAYSTQVRVWSAQKRSRQIAARRSVMQVSGNDQTSGKEERETVPQ